MPSRPQFSLRMLLMIALLVCLAATTARLPVGEADTTERIAVRIQAYLRLAECLLFPAILTAWAVARGGWERTFCIGAVLPAAMPMALVCYYARTLRQNLFAEIPASILEEFNWYSFWFTERITALWVGALLAGLGAVLFRWFLPNADMGDTEARRSVIVRATILACVLAFASVAMIALPESSDTGADASVFRQAPIRLILCLAVPAALAASAIEGRGNLQAFCACALFPALTPVMLVLVGDTIEGQFAGRWEPSMFYQWRYFIVAMWALTPFFGLVCVFFQWLFRLGEAKDDDRGASHK
jgi:hypothetical protein